MSSAKLAWRVLRTAISFFKLLLCTIGFIMVCVPLARSMWSIDKTTFSGTVSAEMVSRPPVWSEFNPASGFCVCEDLHQGYCNEKNDAFLATSWMSVTVLAAQSFILVMLMAELAAFGPYGGTHTITRLTMIVACMTIIAQFVSLLAYYDAYSDNHCGDTSYEGLGATLGDVYYARIAEIVLSFFLIIYVLQSFARTTRGPPCGPILAQAIILIISAGTTFSQRWMTQDAQSVANAMTSLPSLNITTTQTATRYFGTFESCICFEPPGCNAGDASSTMNAAFVLNILGVVFGLLALFFTSLRAVDNEGVTLKFSMIFGVIQAIMTLASLAAFVSFGMELECTVGPITAVVQTYTTFSSAEFMALAVACQLAFLLLNLSDMLPACACLGSSPLGGADDGKKVFHLLWWDHLKDPKTIAHEARNEEDGDDEFDYHKKEN